MGIAAAVTQTPPAHDQANAVVSGSFTTSGHSDPFTAQGAFNVSLWGHGGENSNWTGSVQLERSFDGGTTWIVRSVDGTAGTQYVFSTANKDISLVVQEPEMGVLYRLACTSMTGTADYRISTTGARAATAIAGVGR